MADKKKKGGIELSKVFSRSGGTEERSSLDVDTLRQVVEILEASEVTKLEWRKGDETLVLRRGPATVTQVVHAQGPVAHGWAPPAAPAAAQAPAAGDLLPRPSSPSRPTATAAAPVEKKGHVINSPFVGTFYRNPAPDQPPFVEVGQVVKKGQVICIVEAMKLMNEIESEVAGRVTEVLAENAQPVEFGQALFRIEPV